MKPPHWQGILALAILLVLAAAAPVALAQSGGPYDMTGWTVDGGGGTVSGGAYAVSGTAGQPDASAEATGGVYSLTGGVWGQLAGPPQVTATHPASSLVLTWTSINGLQSYELWRDTAPCFTPGGSPAILVASGNPPAGCTLTAGMIACSRPDGVGNPSINYFYVVRGIRPDLSPADSNRTGEFDFALVK